MQLAEVIRNDVIVDEIVLERFAVTARKNGRKRIAGLQVAGVRKGQVDLAASLMGGRPFSYSGIVIKGRQLGRTLGFPTANIEVPEDKITVRRGVYASLTHIGSSVYPSVTNVGKRPTFDDGDFDNAETHIFDFDEDIYGARIKVDLLFFVRPEMRFDGIEALSAQVESDKIMAKTYHAKSGMMSE